MNENSEQSSITLTGQTPRASNEGAGSSSLAKGRRGSPEEILARRARIWEMRVIQRKSYAEIAKQEGVSIFTVSQDIVRFKRRSAERNKERSDELIAEQDAVYQALLDKWLPIAVAPAHLIIDHEGEEIDAEVNDEQAMYATDRVLRVLGDQAKLHGFVQSVKQGKAAEEMGKAFGDKVMQAMMALAKGSYGKVLEAEIVPTIEDTHASTRHGDTQEGNTIPRPTETEPAR